MSRNFGMQFYGKVKIRPYFKQTTYINWYCINEHFSVEKLNPEFPMK